MGRSSPLCQGCYPVDTGEFGKNFKLEGLRPNFPLRKVLWSPGSAGREVARGDPDGEQKMRTDPVQWGREGGMRTVYGEERTRCVWVWGERSRYF